MKKVVLVLILGVVLCLNGYGQHHLKSFNRIDLGGGKTTQGWFVDANFSHLFSDKLYGVAGGVYEQWSDNGVGAQTYYINLGVYYNLFKIKDFTYFNAGGGLSTMIDRVDPLNESGTTNNSFNYGGYLGIEVENYILNRLSLLITARQGFYVNSDNYGSEIPMVFYVGAGLRLTLSGLRNNTTPKF